MHRRIHKSITVYVSQISAAVRCLQQKKHAANQCPRKVRASCLDQITKTLTAHNLRLTQRSQVTADTAAANADCPIQETVSLCCV